MAEAQAMPEVRASTWTRWIWNDMTTVDSVYPEFKPNWLLFDCIIYDLIMLMFRFGNLKCEPFKDEIVSLMHLVVWAQLIASTLGVLALRAGDEKRLRRVQVLLVCTQLMKCWISFLFLLTPQPMMQLCEALGTDRFALEMRIFFILLNFYGAVNKVSTAYYLTFRYNPKCAHSVTCPVHGKLS